MCREASLAHTKPLELIIQPKVFDNDKSAVFLHLIFYEKVFGMQLPGAIYYFIDVASKGTNVKVGRSDKRFHFQLSIVGLFLVKPEVRR